MGWESNLVPLLIITASGKFTGLFVYSASPPSPGSLILSVAASAGTDPFGNPYLQGLELHGESTLFSMTTDDVAEAAAGTILVATGGSGPSRQLVMEFFSPVFATAISANLALLSQSADLTIPASANFGQDLTVGGNIAATFLGKGLQVKQGANARMGSATLAAGAVTVANTTVTANTQIFVNHHSVGPNAGELGWSTVPGTSFTITSTNAADANSITWLLIEAI